MKSIHYILCCFVLLLLHSQAQASHIKAVNLSYTCLGNYQYEVTMALYADCAGITPPTSASVNLAGLSSCATTTSTTIPVTLVSTVAISTGCPGILTTCNGGSNPGVEEHIYTGTFILPVALRNCDWLLSYSSCCRSGSNTNLINPAGSSFYTEVLSIGNTICNSSPSHNTPSTHTVCSNVPVSISNLMSDPDGDSLVYTLAAPLSAANTSIGFQAGLSPNNPLLTNTPPSGISLNSSTGELIFTAISNQIVDFDIVIYEFRNGVLIGTSRKALSINILTSCTNFPPTLDSISKWSNNNWVSQGSNSTFEACPGEMLSFQMFFSDVDPQDSLSIDGFYSTILNNYPNATIQHSYPSGNSNNLVLQIDIPNVSLGVSVVGITDNICPISGKQSIPINIIAKPSCGRVEGYVFSDTSGNCMPDIGEDSLGAYLITFTRGSFSVTINTDHTGYYNIPLDTGTYTITSSSTLPYRALCSSAQTIVITASSTLLQHDLPIQSTILCPYMEVDIAANRLIRCLDNQYVVQYCNYGTITATMSSIEVTLDSLFVVDSTSLPITSQTGFTYTFNVGNVAPLQCGTFNIYGRLDTACTSPLGRTFCATAYIHPDTTCGIWSGPLLEVEGICQNDSVGFRIRNTGQQAMSGPTNYSVIEDNIVLHNGTGISLASGAVTPWI